MPTPTLQEPRAATGEPFPGETRPGETRPGTGATFLDARLVAGHRSGHGPVVVQVSGEVDVATVPLLRFMLTASIRPGRDLVVDMHRTTFLDAAGIEVLVRIADHLDAEGGRLRIVDPSRAVRRVLQIVDLGDRFGVAPSCRQARTA
jgi:anti-sigma B factor antagonist